MSLVPLKLKFKLIGMCDVTKRNFEELYPKIINDLQFAHFISIDCEFSGFFSDNCKCSLFDTPATRFRKLQNSLKNFIIVQIGLSTFKYESSNNTFSCSTYNFYLKPSAALGNKNFSCEINSCEFLCKNNFDFNKLFYDGIYYLNKSDEAETVKMISCDGLITDYIRDDIRKYCSRVAEWNGSAAEGSEMLLDLESENQTFVYLLHQEIRKKFSSIWTYFGEKNTIRIKKVTQREKELLSSDQIEEFIYKKKLFNSILGFSRIIKELQNLKKPIIGHNFLPDLIMLYQQFYNPSPVTYKSFKRAIADIFPNIYDTKTISFKLKKILKKNTLNSNILADLYDYLKNGKGATLVIYTPAINHINGDYVKTEKFHEAGFDSYCTGFCFVKMAHIFSLWDEQNSKILCTSIHTSTSWLLGAVNSMKNQVNISRGQTNYIVLDGDDPKSVRPDLLCIQSRRNEFLDISKISEIIAKYSAVDIQILTKSTVLMAIGNKRQFQEIMASFKNHPDYKVKKYNFLIHTVRGKMIASVTLVASVVFLVACLKVWFKK